MMIGYRCLLFAVIGLAFVESSYANNCTDVRINNGPLITPCVSEIILQKGQNFTLTCKGVTKLRFRHQDLSEEVTDSKFTIKNTSSQIFEEEFSFQRTLDLYNVDQYAIGYYACSDDTVHENIVNTIIEEPENNEHVSYIYVYVNGTDSLFAPMSEIIMSRSNKILIECRPSTPDVKVELLTKSQNKTPKREYTKYSPKIGFLLKKCDKVAYLCEGLRGNVNETKRIRIIVNDPPVPRVGQVSKWFLSGENFTLNCTANITPSTIVYLRWNFPEGLNKETASFSESKSAENITNGEIYNALTMYNARPDYGGHYSCTSMDSCVPKESNQVLKQYTSKPIMSLRVMTKPGITKQSTAEIKIKFDSHPEANITVLKNGKDLPDNLEIYKNGNLPRGTEKYTLLYRPNLSEIILSIRNLSVSDIADYTIIANNTYNSTSASVKVEVADGPHVNFGVNHKTCDNGKEVTFMCDVSGYPLPNVTWTFSYNDTDNNTVELLLNSTDEILTSVYNKTAYYHNKLCDRKGIITCIATGIQKKKPVSVSKSHQLIVYDIHGGFGISTDSKNGTIWALENNQLSLKCLASLNDFSNLTWKLDDAKMSAEIPEIVDIHGESEFSMFAELKINKLNINHNGKYTCVGEKIDGTSVYDQIEVNVQELQEPMIVNHGDIDEEVIKFDDKYISCTVIGAPLPEIKWYKDGKEILKNSYKNVNVSYKNFNRTAAISSISIVKMLPDNVGTYECVAEGQNSLKNTYILRLKVDKDNNFMHYLIPILVIIVILIIMIVYLTLKVKKEKKFRKELAAAGLLYFKEGVVNSLNPDLGIDEQAELLPYDEKFEFPPEKLVYGKQLGAGAFGVVYKAEARGIINAEETTTVAVKMVKKTADNMYIKALASELKIMVHLGKHINIVNLLGACTKNVGKRELVVIVEYCMYGNIHNYMQRHREVFIDQLETDNKEKLGRVNRAYTSTTGGSTGVQSEYFGSTNTQDTDNTFLNTGNTIRSGRKNIPNNQPMEEVKASECYVQPDWRSNYESDYSYDGRSPRPLTSRDLLAWSFQIARGMEYLASRKVLHGDLAARNILLAEDNIVKICDFGLAKSIYKNEEYQPKENCLLPVKWLAIECMTDRIFSTQSDVWSFGIVLWELFTLAKTPYPNIHPSSLLQFLSEGHRLDKPSYADDRLYEVMKKCWEAKPTLRPTFSHLQELLGTFLEDNVRKHYVDLNSTYMDKHATVSGQEDYLAMMCAPDYNNLVTPSPHHYINTDNEKSFFPPTPVKVDEGGYLQMSPTNQGIFSPRLPNSEFDFDPRKFNPKTSEASSCGSELTPMLTLNNLAARSGSESDHEGNAPYLNVCPRIDEEADEVFAPSINETKNAKNIQHSAVTNPTYITFVNIDEKPKDINSYVNIVPNGLVK